MGGKSGGGGSQVVGYKYFLSLLMGACRGPVDEITEIRVGDRVAWSGLVTSSSRFAIAARNLFGGDDKEGGIEGDVVLHMGTDDQVLTDGAATATLTFGSQPAEGDTVTIGAEVFTFTAYVPPTDGAGNDQPAGNENGGESF